MPILLPVSLEQGHPSREEVWSARAPPMTLAKLSMLVRDSLCLNNSRGSCDQVRGQAIVSHTAPPLPTCTSNSLTLHSPPQRAVRSHVTPYHSEPWYETPRGGSSLPLNNSPPPIAHHHVTPSHSELWPPKGGTSLPHRAPPLLRPRLDLRTLPVQPRIH